MPSKRFRIISLHVAAWACFITYEVAVAISMGSKADLSVFAIFYTLNIILFYFNSEIVFKVARKGPSAIILLAPLMLIELLAYVGSSLLIGLFIYNGHTGWSKWSIVRDDAVRAAWRGIYFLGWSIGYWLCKRYIAINKQANTLKILSLEAEKRKAEAERSRAETEKNLAVAQVAYLKAQINPHFLYNTLSYIYDSVQEVSEETANSILLLSEIMHYSLDEVAGDGKVPLHDEIMHIRRFIELTQLRFSNDLNIYFEGGDEADYTGYSIPPLILLTFVENVFKHGDLMDPERQAEIKVDCKEKILYLRTINFKRKNGLPSNHMGLVNARTRLNLYYPSAHHLIIDDQAEKYIMQLNITL